MKLSIIVPSIRPQNLLALYESIDLPMEDFELIAIGPFSPPFKADNMKFIGSYRSPNAAQQQGLLEARGEYIAFCADDGVFLPGVLDHIFINLLFASQGDFPNHKDIIVGKYLEGDNPHPDMHKKDYYKFKYHKAYRLKGVPQENLIFNCGIISRKFIMELGGWDAENFDCTTMAHADLGIRASKAGAKFSLMDKVIFKCSHEPKRTGTHGPVHDAMKKDIKKFKRIYSKPNDRINIDINNWKNTQVVWKERFK